MSELVTYRLKDGVATIRFDDGKVNAMSPAMLQAIGDAFDRAEGDGAVVMLIGRDGIFSAGFDLKTLMKGSPSDALAMVKQGAELALRVLTFPLPVVAACTGHAYPMGAFLLLASDVRFGADGPYRIGLNEVAIKISVPAFGVELARQRLLPAYLNRTTLTGEMFAPSEAATAGFLDHVVAPEALETTAATIAAGLTAINLEGHAATKTRVRRPAADAIRAAIDAELTLEAYEERAARLAAQANA